MDWIQCVQVEEEQRIQDLANKCFEFPSQIFLVLPLGGRESRNEEDRWTEIKTKIHLNTSFDEKQTNELWSLFEQFQDIFAWHKGKLGHRIIGEHIIDTQGFPPCQMTPRRLTY